MNAFQHWSADLLRGPPKLKGARCRHYLEVHYEDLVLNSARVLGQICDFINLPYSAAMETYHRTVPARLAEHQTRWRSDGTALVTHAQRIQQQRLTQTRPDATRV